MNFAILSSLFVTVIKTAINSNASNSSEAIVNNKNIRRNVKILENDGIKKYLINNKAQQTPINRKREDDIYYDPLQFQGDAAVNVIHPKYEKIEVEGVHDAEGANLIDILKRTLEENKFSQKGYIQDLLKLLYKSLGTELLINEEHKETLLLLGDVLAKGHPKSARFNKTLKLLGEAITHSKIIKKELYEIFRFIGKILETDKSTDEEAFELLANMLVHRVRPGLHHYERLGLEAVNHYEMEKLKEESLQKFKYQKRLEKDTIKRKAKYRKCKKGKKCKKHKHRSKKRRIKRDTAIENPTSTFGDVLLDARSPDTNSNVIMMSDDQNAYIEYNNPEDTIIQPIIENQKAIDSLNNTRPPTFNVNFNVANINKVHFESSRHDDFNSEHGNHIPNRILTRDIAGNVRTVPVAGSKFQSVSSKDINVKPQIKSNIPNVIRIQNRITLIFNVGRIR